MSAAKDKPPIVVVEHWWGVENLKTITGLVTAVGVILLGFVNFFASRRADNNAKVVHTEVKSVHRLMNSQHTHLLKTVMVATRQLALVSKKPEDEVAANKAEEEYTERLRAESEQAKLDADARAKLIKESEK